MQRCPYTRHLDQPAMTCRVSWLWRETEQTRLRLDSGHMELHRTAKRTSQSYEKSNAKERGSLSGADGLIIYVLGPSISMIFVQSSCNRELSVLVAARLLRCEALAYIFLSRIEGPQAHCDFNIHIILTSHRGCSAKMSLVPVGWANAGSVAALPNAASIDSPPTTTRQVVSCSG